MDGRNTTHLISMPCSTTVRAWHLVKMFERKKFVIAANKFLTSNQAAITVVELNVVVVAWRGYRGCQGRGRCVVGVISRRGKRRGTPWLGTPLSTSHSRHREENYPLLCNMHRMCPEHWCPNRGVLIEVS